MTSAVGVRLESVHVYFGNLHIIDGLSFLAQPATLTALVGPSGSGKSTILGLIAGVREPSRGKVQFRQWAGASRPPISWVFQSSPIFPRRSALSNIELGALSVGKSLSEARQTAVHIMHDLEIDHLQSQRAYRLSGGERQRVVVARSMATGASIILADEPTAALDASSRASVVHALREASNRGASVIIATHDQHVAQACDLVVTIGTNSRDNIA